MELEWILRIILFGIVHWILAGFMINDLISKKKVFGGHKAPWVILVILLPCFGSLIYLAFHPQIFYPR
jgi:hypothetical protein